jgi:hypothetical protein
MFNSRIDKVQPEQVTNSQVQLIVTTSSPTIANTLVVGCFISFGV